MIFKDEFGLVDAQNRPRIDFGTKRELNSGLKIVDVRENSAKRGQTLQSEEKNRRKKDARAGFLSKFQWEVFMYGQATELHRVSYFLSRSAITIPKT